MTKEQEPADKLAARLTEEVSFDSGEFLHDADEMMKVATSELAPEVNVATENIPPTIPDVIDSPETAKQAAEAVGEMSVTELKAELKAQILDELKDEQVKKMELEKERRERETEEQQAYVQRMKESPDPWVEIVGWVRDSQGVRTELEWNDAFVDYLRAEGITGIDDDAVVQKWVVVLMHDMADRMDGEKEGGSEFEG